MFVGKRAAIVSSTSLDPAGFPDLVERAVAMAKVVPEDPFTGLADTWAPPEEFDLDMADPAEPAPEAWPPAPPPPRMRPLPCTA